MRTKKTALLTGLFISAVMLTACSTSPQTISVSGQSGYDSGISTSGEGTVKVVPDMAVVKLTGSGDRFVYVVGADNKVTFKKVELGRRLDTEYEIVSGLSSGDNVVVEGQNRVTNGMEVVVVE